MNITIHGNTYAVMPAYLKTKSVQLLQEEDTKVFYVTADKTKINPYDTILIVNTRLRSVFPLFLSVFNDMVNEYSIPLIRTFPAVYVIVSSMTEFWICDLDNVSKVRNYVNNHYIAYAETANILMIAPSLYESFEMFTNQRIAAYERQANKRVSIAEATGFNTPPAEQATPKAPEHASVQAKPVQTPVQVQNQSPPAKKDFVPGPPPPKPQTTEVLKPKLIFPSRENLWKYCEIDENCLVISLTINRELAIVNKRNGTVKRFSYDELIDNELLGLGDEADILQCIGKTVNIMYDTEKVILTDIRHVIRMFEQRKESPATKHLIAYSDKTVYVALAPENTNASIKQFTIDCHKQSSVNYETLKTKLKAFSRDIYFVITKQNTAVMVVYDDGKKAYDVPFSELYALYPEAKNVGDLMRLFPIEYILNGIVFDIEQSNSIRSVVPVSPSSFSVSSSKHYTVKGINFGYDTRARVMMKAPVETR